METTYIQFQAPKKSKSAATQNSFKNFIKNFATRALTKIFPIANPDFDKKIDEIEYWLVECGREKGIPQREIGLDKQRRVIMKMPINDNYGYWTDNNLLLNDFKVLFEVSEITKEAFEQHWSLI
jgi:hypothetical protein